MELKPIKSEKEYLQMLEWVDQQFDKVLSKSTSEGEQLKKALLFIKDYEDKKHSIPFPDSLEVRENP